MNQFDDLLHPDRGTEYKTPRSSRSRYSFLKPGENPRVILIHGSPYVITIDGRGKLHIMRNTSLLIRDGVIEDVFDASNRSHLSLSSIDVIYDAEQRGGVVVTPGFINAHAHPPMYLLRSALAFEETDLTTSLKQMALLEQHMSESDYVLGAIGDFTEEQRWGVTTILSHYALFEPIEAAARITHQRVINAVSAASNTHPKNSPELVERYLKQKAQYVTEPAIALHYLHKASPTVLRKVAQLIKNYHVLLTLHSAETPSSVERCIQVHGDRPVKILERYGILGPRVIISHGIYLSEEEVRLIKKRNAGVVHLPTSNLLHRSGTFNYPLFKKVGATSRIALGTDSVISKNRLDLLSEALQAKTLHQEMSNVKYVELFNMITAQGAAILGLEKAGRIAPGYQADLAFWKLKDRGFLPFDESDPSTLVSNMITHGGHNIRDLMVNGQFVISNRMHNIVQEGVLLERLHEAHRALRARLKEK